MVGVGGRRGRKITVRETRRGGDPKAVMQRGVAGYSGIQRDVAGCSGVGVRDAAG